MKNKKILKKIIVKNSMRICLYKLKFKMFKYKFKNKISIKKINNKNMKELPAISISLIDKNE